MNLNILGCAGGIGGRERLTTCLAVDRDILLDAGTGLTSLEIGQLIAIDHVFLTHSHLDHVAGLALLVDAIQGKKAGPITIHATREVMDVLKRDLFNWALWPDFAAIPNPENPAMRWELLEPGKAVELDGRLITPYPVNHTPGAVAYWVHNHVSGFLFSGDMCATPDLWSRFAGEHKLRQVIVDCSFPNADADIANRSMHFCPRSLIQDIRPMAHAVDFLIYHLKPGQEDLIMRELESGGDGRVFAALKCGDCFTF